jgi:hypothetical protein
MLCQYQAIEGDLKRCTRCGDERIASFPPEQIRRECNRRGLGDYVAMGLAAFGVVKKKRCGCPKRQHDLNEIGAKVGL